MALRIRGPRAECCSLNFKYHSHRLIHSKIWSQLMALCRKVMESLGSGCPRRRWAHGNRLGGYILAPLPVHFTLPERRYHVTEQLSSPSLSRHAFSAFGHVFSTTMMYIPWELKSSHEQFLP